MKVLEASGHPVEALHGVTLAQIVDYLVERVGFVQLAVLIPINCFLNEPSTKSSLTFLRRTPWARAKVEALYVQLRTEELQVLQMAGPASNTETLEEP